MNRLIRIVGVLPLVIMLLILLVDSVGQTDNRLSFIWLSILALNCCMAFIKLDNVRDGIKGILYSGIVVNVLLFATYLLGEPHSIATIAVFISYSVFTFIIAILDLINTKYVLMSKAEKPFQSSEVVFKKSDEPS